jgi:hypothetical protein
MDYRNFRQIETQRKALELSAFLLNKIITDIKVIKTWKENEISQIVLTFSDRTSIEICAYTERGCSECDADGALVDYLGFYTHKAKQ